MELTRRRLFKIAGFTLLGLSVKPALDVFSKVDLPEPSPVAGPSAQKRWAMAVDVKKCWSVEGCRDCIDACHRVHNVPSFPSTKEEIKWIWTVPFGKAFAEHDHDLMEEGEPEKPLVLLCNHRARRCMCLARLRSPFRLRQPCLILSFRSPSAGAAADVPTRRIDRADR